MGRSYLSPPAGWRTWRAGCGNLCFKYILTKLKQAYLIHVPIIHPGVFLQGFKVHGHILVNHFHNLHNNIYETWTLWTNIHKFWTNKSNSPQGRFSKCISGRMWHLGRAMYRSPWRMKESSSHNTLLKKENLELFLEAGQLAGILVHSKASLHCRIKGKKQKLGFMFSEFNHTEPILAFLILTHYMSRSNEKRPARWTVQSCLVYQWSLQQS